MFQKFRMGKSCTPIRQTAVSFVTGRIRPERKTRFWSLYKSIFSIKKKKKLVRIFVILPDEDKDVN